MSGNPWAAFFWNDWQGDPLLRLCSLAGQGLWMRLLCIAAESEEPGHVIIAGRNPSAEDLTKLCGAPAEEIARLVTELENNGVFSRDHRGFIYSRRMVRDFRKRSGNAKGGKKGGKLTRDKQLGIHATRVATREGTRADPQRVPEKGLAEGLATTRARTTSNTNTNTRGSGDAADNGFEHWYDNYPRKLNRQKAREAYAVAITKTDAKTLLSAARAYAASVVGEPEKFTKHPTTWLNQEAWLDYPPEPAPQPNGAAHPRANGSRGLSPTDEHYRAIMAAWVRTGGLWAEEQEGPKPGQVGCRVPVAIQAEFALSSGDSA